MIQVELYDPQQDPTQISRHSRKFKDLACYSDQISDELAAFADKIQARLQNTSASITEIELSLALGITTGGNLLLVSAEASGTITATIHVKL
jgi:hypothetical protein